MIKPRPILNVIAIILSIMVGLVFVLSALTKIYPIEPFEFTFIGLGIGSWNTAPFIARFMIGCEFLCAALLILNFNMRRVTIPIVSTLLVIFIAYLLWIMVKGDGGNCGCFGSYIPMTPVQALLKNIVLLAICGFLYFAHRDYRFPWSRAIFIFLMLLSLSLPFILNVVDLQTSKNLQPDSVNYAMPIDILYHSQNPDNKPPSIDLHTGKYIIGYLSLTCSHCKIAAQKISLLHNLDPSTPFFLVLNGDKNLYDDYVKTYKLEAVPHILFRGPAEYIKMAGANLPMFYWVNNGIVEKKGNAFQLTPLQISTWLDHK